MMDRHRISPDFRESATRSHRPGGKVFTLLWESVMFRNHDVRYILLLLGLSLLTWIPRFRGPIDLRYDAGVYYILGTSLAEGKGYRLLNEPGKGQAIQYPPLLPALVAFHQRALGTSDHQRVGQWLRITYAILFTLYVLSVYVLTRKYLTPGYAFLVTLIV